MSAGHPLCVEFKEYRAIVKGKGMKPGKTAPQSGQYHQIGPCGGKGKEVTVTKGEHKCLFRTSVVFFDKYTLAP